ncbi:MAG: stage IV sporulation protein A [Lachnospiraceae bacterium]|nr:stage IV sporulation protein A [Lachnospiraceae bacterium]
MDNVTNREFDLYKDIQMRTGGDLYLGIIGPVRTGKSTLIKRMMDLLVLPNIEEGPEKARIMDELPQSGTGRTITTTEPKFLPKEAFMLKLSEDVQLKVRLIDCVGYMVDGAVGHMEDDQPRLVKTPWLEDKIPFVKAAEIGTRKVMQDHSTMGIVVTCDGSFSDIPREQYIEAEQRTVDEMKKLGKPFVLLLNSNRPFSESAMSLAKDMQNMYQIPVLPMNLEQLRMEDVRKIFENLLREFPVTEIEFYMPKWVEMLSEDSKIKEDLMNQLKKLMLKVHRIQDVTLENFQMDSPYISKVQIDKIDLSTGVIRVKMDLDEAHYYEMLSQMTGEHITGEYDLLGILKELSKMKKEYAKVHYAIDAVRQKGYGVVMPIKEEICLEDPAIVKQGSKYGVKIKASAPSIHLIRANIETEVSPLVGSESQASDLIKYIGQSKEEEGSIWGANIFGKSIEELVEDGIKSKVYQIGEESQLKLQETMQKIVNDSNGGMVCIII